MAKMILEENERILGKELKEDAQKNITKKRGGRKANEKKN